MADFNFVQDPSSKKWVILAPRRAKRPDVAVKTQSVCPFCYGKEKEEPDVYRVPARQRPEPQAMAGGGGEKGDSNWQIRVIPNKFPFAQFHELIVHSPDHHKNFGELPLDQVELILKTYRQRYNFYKEKGQVYIFHNRGEGGGESLPHPHTQLVIIPNDVKAEIPLLQTDSLKEDDLVETSKFMLFCPATSQWPDESWIIPKRRGDVFGSISDEEISELAFVLSRLVQILDLRHGHEFPFNFYVYPGADWYLRLIPRVKSLGGFEVGTGIFVNTQDPKETLLFIKEHFDTPNEEKIRREHQAEYGKTV